jgi:hypothetical protein
LTTSDKQIAASNAAAARLHLQDVLESRLADATREYEEANETLEMRRELFYAAILDAREAFTIRDISARTGLSSARIAQITKEGK